MSQIPDPTECRLPPGVLIVDDEAVIVDELMEFFAGERIHAIAANDAFAALSAYKDAAPGSVTVVLTDVKMPGQDGLSFAQTLLAIVPEADAVEVIVMTGHGSFGMAVEALRSRVFDFIRKPLKLTELNATIARAHTAAIGRRTRARESDATSAQLREMTLAMSLRNDALIRKVHDEPEWSGSHVLQVISREMRNPLFAVVGIAELIEENSASLKPGQVAEYAGQIRQAGWQLTNLIEAIEAASGATPGADGTAPPTEKVSDIVAALLLGHGVEARQSGLTLAASPAPDAHIPANRACLMLALDQLIIDAIRRGKPGQTIRIEAESYAGEMVFRIVDEGSLPEPHAPVAGQPPGLGLGLADCIALMLGGRLVLRSLPGGGINASIALPLGSAPLGSAPGSAQGTTQAGA